jgi:parvulin-like peptidyl-prolyl isomerase
MEMKIRLLFVPLLLALVASLAACGGSQHVPANAVAVVNGTPITITQFNDFIDQAIAQVKAQGGAVPTPGSPQYSDLRARTVSELVQLTAATQAGQKDGVTVTSADVDKFIADLVKTKYAGSMKKFEDALKSTGLSMQAAREQVRISLLGTRLQAKVTSTAKVAPADVKKYYDANPTQFTTPATLKIAASKKLANSIEQKLKNGGSFAKLAKQYSQDPGSAAQGGKFTAIKGQLTPAYEKAAFSLKTGQLSAPIDATSTANNGYGYFIIKALGPVKKTGTQETRSVEHILVSVKTKPKPETFKQAQPGILQGLLQQQKTKLWEQWLSDLQNEYKGKVSYQSGYAPPTTTALPTTG